MTHTISAWRNQKTEREYLGKTGIILTWTEIHVAPSRFSAQTPYAVALIEFDSNERRYVQLVGVKNNDVKIGSKVKIVLRRLYEGGKEDIIRYGLKAKLL